MMTEEIATWDAELLEVEQKLENLIKSLPNASENSKRSISSDINDLFGMASRYQHSFKAELRGLTNTLDQRTYNEKFQEHQKNIARLNNEYKWSKEANRTAVGLDGNRQGPPGGRVPPQAPPSAQQVMEETLSTQGRSKQIVGNMIRTTEQTKDVAASTAVALTEQREQLERVREDLAKIENNMDRAKAELKVIVKRLATDKIIMCFLCLIVLAVVAVIIMKIIGK